MHPAVNFHLEVATNSVQYYFTDADGNPLEVNIASVQITDVNGNVMLTSSAAQNEPINLSSLDSGIYILRVTLNEGSVFARKFAKQRSQRQAMENKSVYACRKSLRRKCRRHRHTEPNRTVGLRPQRPPHFAKTEQPSAGVFLSANRRHTNQQQPLQRRRLLSEKCFLYSLFVARFAVMARRAFWHAICFFQK